MNSSFMAQGKAQRKAVTRWIQPQFLNLMNEFADAEMFLVDGDSLLMELALDCNLDWKFSGQFLHLVYLFERYLHMFVRKDGVFQIVFFKDFDKVWKSKPAMHLARKIIMQHLFATTNYKVLDEFRSPWDSDFVKYIKHFVPSFMLLSDGEVVLSRNKGQQLIPEQASEIFILHYQKILSLELNCAFVDGIEFGTSSLKGFHIMFTQQFQRWGLLLPEQILFALLNNFQTSIDNASLTKVIDDVLIQLKRNPALSDTLYQDKGGVVDCRLILHVVTSVVYFKLFQREPFQVDLIRVLLLHGVFLTQLPLRYRAFSLDDCGNLLGDSTKHSQLQSHLKHLEFIMAEVLNVQALKDGKSLSGVCDVWDGRLLHQILSLLLKSKNDGNELPLSKSSQLKFKSLVHVVSSLQDKPKLEPFPILQHLRAKDFGFSSSRKKSTLPISNIKGLIQLECPLLNEYAGEILESSSVKKLDINDPDVADLVVSGNDFDEIYHWHSGKPLSDDYSRTKDNNTDESELSKNDLMKRRNKFARYMQRYGQSLQGEATSKSIVVEKSIKQQKKEKTKVSKKAVAIREENNKKIEEAKLKKVEESWLRVKMQIYQFKEEGRYRTAIDYLNRFLTGVTDGGVRADVLLTRAKISWKIWKECCKKGDGQCRDNKSIAETLFLTIQELLEKYQENLGTKEKDSLGRYLHGLGFEDIVSKRNLTTKSFKSRRECSLKISSSRFQLQNLGDQLKRETRMDPDSRVSNFVPETWQRELLDAVDNKQSALIVAPTSSGKTFASYYCMERVLKEDNDGVVVYVSPTKALVNQVAATCYVRYKKEMPAGKSVYGVFTRDYRHNALNCQILVTVPQCLEILLLSPARRDWVARIRYVVFDEVHCIGSEIGAEVWEHLLLLIRCPFLALSATIRNPDILHRWLQSAEHDKLQRDRTNNTLRPNVPRSYTVALVTHGERYNDLEKFNYLSAEEEKLDYTLTVKRNPKPEIQHIHPCSLLTSRQLKQCNTFPAHVSLSPRETLAFYDALHNAFPEKKGLLTLSPEWHFQNETFITKQSVRSYENALKKELMKYVQNGDDRVDTIFHRLGSNRTLSGAFEKNFLISQIYQLIEKLKENDQLPVIVFSFDRALCEEFAEELVECLQEIEEELKEKKTAERPLRKTEKRRQKRQRDAEDVDEVKRKTGSAGHKESHQQTKTTAEATCFLVDDPPPESCSYAGTGVLDAADAHVIVERLERTDSGDDEMFKEGLRRGISYHHAGMASKYRSVVEMLFRKKFLRVVFATGTLALGIHMPCKTVVFAGDSVFLNTLQYHQISGRAGRRGYDLIGNVIFFGTPEAKIQRLITVNLPRIIGNFPLNISLVLRLLLLVNKAEDRETAKNQALTLLQNPLICKNQPELDIQLKHHFLFSVELLVRQGLVDEKGHPQGLAGLATHLHYHEPSNLVFVAFLNEGLLHKFCAKSRGKAFSKDFLKSLVVLLSHLFARRRLHEMVANRPRSTSKVILQNLPTAFKNALKKYNDKVHEVFDLYLRTVAAHVHDTLGEDITLPLSGTRFISSENYEVCSAEDQAEKSPTLEEKLQEVAQPYIACSAFTALSGNTDNRLYSSKDLISNIRYQVYTDVKVVPTLDPDVNLNAYAYDFFNHGNYKALIQENGLMHGDAFNLLKDFMMVLKSISTSLTELAPEDGDDVTAAFTQLAEEFASKFYDAFP